jgi:hypothetical protein
MNANGVWGHVPIGKSATEKATNNVVTYFWASI